MRHVTFAYLGKDDEAARFAKKGTTSDITLFNAKKGDAHLNLVTPARFPDKLLSLLLALDMADELLLPAGPLDRGFGETVLAADLMGKRKGYLIGGDAATLEPVRALLAKTGLQGLVPWTDGEARLREKLYESAAATQQGSLVLPIDHAFAVKGVGTVALGLVRAGKVERHQTLRLHPTEKTVEVRSIQVHDVDVEEAPTRSRVGCALKGIEAEEMGRGNILAPPGSLSVHKKDDALRLRLAFTPFMKWEPRAGAVLHLFHALQFVALRVDTVADATKEGALLTGRLESPLTLVPHAPLVAVDLDSKTHRLIGRAKLGG